MKAGVLEQVGTSAARGMCKQSIRGRLATLRAEPEQFFLVAVDPYRLLALGESLVRW